MEFLIAGAEEVSRGEKVRSRIVRVLLVGFDVEPLKFVVWLAEFQTTIEIALPADLDFDQRAEVEHALVLARITFDELQDLQNAKLRTERMKERIVFARVDVALVDDVRHDIVTDETELRKFHEVLDEQNVVQRLIVTLAVRRWQLEPAEIGVLQDALVLVLVTVERRKNAVRSMIALMRGHGERRRFRWLLFQRAVITVS